MIGVHVVGHGDVVDQRSVLGEQHSEIGLARLYVDHVPRIVEEDRYPAEHELARLDRVLDGSDGENGHALAVQLDEITLELRQLQALDGEDLARGVEEFETAALRAPDVGHGHGFAGLQPHDRRQRARPVLLLDLDDLTGARDQRRPHVRPELGRAQEHVERHARLVAQEGTAAVRARRGDGEEGRREHDPPGAAVTAGCRRGHPQEHLLAPHEERAVGDEAERAVGRFHGAVQRHGSGFEHRRKGRGCDLAIAWGRIGRDGLGSDAVR